MRIAKGRKRLIWILLVFGLPLLVYGSVRQLRPGPDPAQLPGPRPGAMLMSLAVGDALRHRIPDPESLEGQEVYGPAEDHLDGVACWRFPVIYRTRTSLGGLVLHRGALWVKDGRVIREQWD
jgi:hypothetical protein